jgi:hypothetical protein
VHTELTAMIAREHLAELAAEAERRRRHRHLSNVRRPSVRTRLGWTLTRWGARLAPSPTVPATPSRPARMAT